MDDIEKKSVIAKQTRKRIPLGTRNVLTAPKRPGYARRFVNATGDRVQAFKDASWNVVEGVEQVGDVKAGQAGLMGSLANPSVGSDQRAVLMEIPEEILEADRAESQKAITKVENEIRRSSKPNSGAESYGTVSIS